VRLGRNTSGCIVLAVSSGTGRGGTAAGASSREKVKSFAARVLPMVGAGLSEGAAGGRCGGRGVCWRGVPRKKRYCLAPQRQGSRHARHSPAQKLENMGCCYYLHGLKHIVYNDVYWFCRVSPVDIFTA